MLNALKKILLQNHVVNVVVNTHKNARHSEPLAPHVENEIIMQTSVEVTLKERKAIAHSETKFVTQKIPRQDAVSEDGEISEDQTIVMEKSIKCWVTRKSTGSPIPATHQAINVSSTTSRSTKLRAKAFERPAPSS